MSEFDDKMNAITVILGRQQGGIEAR